MDVKRFMDLSHLDACLKDAVKNYGVESVRELCEKYTKLGISKEKCK